MKLENVEVSSQGSQALQLREAKSKSKSGGTQQQQGPAGCLAPACSLLLSCWEACKGHSVSPCWLPCPCSQLSLGAPWHARGWAGLRHGPGL